MSGTYLMRYFCNNPYKFHLLLAFILSVCLGMLLWYLIPIHPLGIYLIVLTGVTFLFYGYDKHQSIDRKRRIPERVLHLLALMGGTLGALAGQLFFRHKTKKLKFRVIFITIAVLQTGLILWWYVRKP